VRTIPELEPAAAQHIAGRSGTIGAVRVDLRHVTHLQFRALANQGGADFALIVDEPPGRGGANAGPSPLQYFLGGAVSCLLTQYAKLTIARGLAVEDLGATNRGHIHYVVDGRFVDMVVEVRLTGTASREAVETLAREAERHCYVVNTLKAAIPLTTRVTYNGEEIAVLTSAPQGQRSGGRPHDREHRRWRHLH